MVLAHEEAIGFKHGYIGTEHILLGLLGDPEGFAARVLGSFELTVALQAKIDFSFVRSSRDAARTGKRSKMLLRLKEQSCGCCQGIL